MEQNIPNEICEIIALYHKQNTVFAIGSGVYLENDCFEPFSQLNHLELLPQNIYRNNESLMIITSNNQLYAIGDNQGCRLGIAQDEKQIEKELVKIMDNVKFVSKGGQNSYHCFIQTIDNKLYASGSNYSGYLGNGIKTKDWTDYMLIPISTGFLRNSDEYVIEIAASKTLSIFLSNYGLLYSCGSGSHRHLQYGERPAIPTLIPIDDNEEPIVNVCCGDAHNMALDKKGRLMIWGHNYHGQLGMDLDEDTLYNKPTFSTFFTDNAIKLKCIEAGGYHSLCIDIDGNGYLFGANDEGQIGNGDKNGEIVNTPFEITDVISEKIIDGSLGDNHSVLLTKEQNNVIVFGDNASKQCSSLCGDHKILEPYILAKEREIGTLETSFVERVLAINNVTIIFIDPCRSVL